MQTNAQNNVARPLRVAVIGAGPAGFYATHALLRSSVKVSVDLFERLPSPYGLVSYGVAPDHPVVKSKSVTFDLIMKHEAVRYFGNVTLGQDITHGELKRHYDAIIYTVGASSDKSLGIPGENLPGSLSATEFVAWYNAHPDHADLDPPLDAQHAAVIGMGNVALDVTRALLKDPDALAESDMAGYAVDALRRSSVTDVHILGRRGPSQANFTPKELREVGELLGVDIVVDPSDLESDQEGTLGDALGAKQTRRNVELFTEYSRAHKPRTNKRVHIHFFVSPVEIRGDGRVQGLKLERNRLEPKGDRFSAVGTGEFESLDIGLLLRSVGYRSQPLAGVPFDEKRGVISNESGRVTTLEGEVITGEYTSGWVRRGPSGVIGTNKIDAEEVVAHLLADLPTLPRARVPEPDAVNRLLGAQGVRYVTKEGWRRIDRAERRAGGLQSGRWRVKFASVEAMLEAAEVEPSAVKHEPRAA